MNTMVFTQKQEIIDGIKKNISTIDAQAIKALGVIFEFQTSDEQSSMTTSELNGMGFCACDAEILTSFYKQYESKGYLSPKQMSILKKKIGKYASQLFRNACNKGIYVKVGKEWTINKVA